MKLILTILFGLVLQNLSAQSIERQVIGSCGSSSIINGIEHSFTVGETFVSTNENSPIRLYAGFQQASDTLNTISIDEINGSTAFRLYPNPTNGKSILKMDVAGSAVSYDVTVYSIHGAKVFETVTSEVLGVKNIPINLSNYSKGIYFVRVSNKQGFAKTFKLIKI